MNIKIIFEGDYKQIGLQHGRFLKDDISKTLETYIGMWGIPQEKIPCAVSGFKKIITDEYPHLAEEIRGISEGSGIDEDFIYAINSRTELFSGSSSQECTSVGVPSSSHDQGHIVLAQNWDWYSHFRDLAKVVELRPDGKLRLKMLVEPGMVGKIGMNEAGLGVCMNFLPTEQIDAGGVPVHVVLRNILECEDYSSAEKYVFNARRAASANYLLGHKNGNVGGLETTPEDVRVVSPNPLISHTNSYTVRGESCLRNKLFDLVASSCLGRSLEHKMSTDEVNRALNLVRFPRASRLEMGFFDCIRRVCEKFGLSYAHLFYGRCETVRRVNLDLTEGILSVSSGAKADPFAVHRFN